MQPLQICIGPTKRIGRESWCLPYAGFFIYFSFLSSRNLSKIVLVLLYASVERVGVSRMRNFFNLSDKGGRGLWVFIFFLKGGRGFVDFIF